MNLSLKTLCLVAALGTVGCGDDDRPSLDAAVDGSVHVPDAGADASPTDTGMDTADVDTADGGRTDTGQTDAGLDAPMDATRLDVGRDAGTDANLAPGECLLFGTLGCGDGEWCEPNVDLDEGTCIVSGMGVEGAACEENTECRAGLVCTGTCSRACDPGAPEGTDANPCGLGEGCGSLVPSDPSKLGVCVPACNYDGGLACRDSGLLCQPNELVSTPFDLCVAGMTLPEQGDCGLATLRHGMLCGPARICLDRPDLLPGNLCYQVCRRTEGPLGVDEHPDCVSPTQVCQPFALGLGVCVAP